MKLAVNYSTMLVTLLEQYPDLPIDFIKVPTRPFPGCWEQFNQSRQWRPLLPHLAQPGVIALGHPDPEQRFNETIVGKALASGGAKYLSTHVEARVEYLPEYASAQHQLEPLVYQKLSELFLQSIGEVQAKLAVPLVIENYPYYRWSSQYRWGSEPEFITDLCESTNCGFLLDLAHARCTAWSNETMVEELIAGYPLNRLREIHLAGVQKRQEGLRDTHTSLEEADYDLLIKVLRKSEAEIISIEYGGLPEQLKKPDGTFEPIYRNSPEELLTMIGRIRAIISY